MTWTDRWLRAEHEARPRLLVVGGASLDVIHVRGVPTRTPGGAGLYTALAAARAGVEVTMLAPVPDPMPEALAPAMDIIRWVGPTVPLDGLPRFEIAYDDDGAVTFFREYLGAEPDMTPALLDLVDDLPGCAYCVPFLDARLQAAFIDALQARGCLTIASTYGKAAREEVDVVRATAARADVFFCNEDEATVLFGSVTDAACAPGRFRFVTRAAAGATVFQSDLRTDVPVRRVDAVDPTGAGDTFCGTTVARLLLGDHPVHAAAQGNSAASEMVTAVGPAALWHAPREVSPDLRVVVDHAQVAALAGLLAGMDDLHGFAFTGDLFPAVGAPGVLDWWFASVLQQYGFWYSADGVYAGPMILELDGADRKGSDHLWAHHLRWWRRQPDAMSPAGQLAADDDEWNAYPDPDVRAALAAAYGRTMTALGLDPSAVVAAASVSPRPLHALLRLLDHVGGYREDPWRKKAALLGVILRQRPEHFLAGDDDAPPIVDYHVQRTALRTGMVEVHDPALHAALVARREIGADDEAAVRLATFDAVQLLATESGRPMGAVDWFLFQMRHRCPEMSVPDCASCPASPTCVRRVELFQPVFRTTAY